VRYALARRVPLRREVLGHYNGSDHDGERSWPCVPSTCRRGGKAKPAATIKPGGRKC